MGFKRRLSRGDIQFMTWRGGETPKPLFELFRLIDELGNALQDPEFIAVLTELVNQGYWFFDD